MLIRRREIIINDGVEILKIQAEAFGSKIALYPTLILDDESAVLVDVGMPGGWQQIRAVMIENGVEPQKLKAIILTHQDLDHIGSIEEIKQDLGNSIIVYAPELDKPYIEGSAVICYHGGLCEWRAKDQIERLVNQLL